MDYFRFYHSYYETFCKLKTDAEQLEFVKAILEYMFESKEKQLSYVPDLAFTQVKSHLASSKQYSEYGKLGGAPKGNQNARKNKPNNPKTTPLEY